jgi:hypothetical protein
MYYLLIVIVVAGVFFYLYRLKKLNIPDTKVQEEVFVPQKKWVFNGILDIDCPPDSMEPFADFHGSLSLRVKPGYMHYDIVLNGLVDDKFLGLYPVVVKAEPDGGISVIAKGVEVGKLPEGQKKLFKDLTENGGKALDAYAYIAKHYTKEQIVEFFGEVALKVRA